MTAELAAAAPSATALLAAIPIALLVGLVLRGRWSTATNAAVALAAALVLAVVAFGAGPAVVAVGVGKGLWSGVWILYVIWAALLLYHVAVTAGLERLGPHLSDILPRPIENVLIVAWIFPAFVQGVAGFGIPIAVAAPLLVAMGYGPVRAVALPLVGYHWSVTFGSMGSSFYMGALTAGLEGAALTSYARDAGLMLAVNMAIAGVLVCLLHGGRASLREGARLLVVAVPVMAVTLVVAVHVEPSIGSLAAATAGLGVVAVRRVLTRRGVGSGEAGDGGGLPVRPRASLAATAPHVGELPDAGGDIAMPATGAGAAEPVEAATVAPSLAVLLPYAYLLALVLGVFLPAATRAFVKSHALVGPAFPATRTTEGTVNAAVTSYTPIALLGHPGTYILLAAVLGYVTYRVRGQWAGQPLRPVLGRWIRQSWQSTPSVLALTTLAGLMVDAGMIRALATGIADWTGALFPVVSSAVGALGSFTTGSTTTSNALFSALQRDVALITDVRPSALLAAQTAGGNVGNALAPVVILIGATAVQARDRVGEVFRAVLWPAAVLLVAVTVMTLVAIGVRT